MLLKTRGIVLHARKYGESSLICEVFTEARGLRRYIIGGVRKPKARISAALLQPMSILDMVVYHHDDRDLTRIKEIQPALLYRQIPFDVRKGAVGLFLVEVIRKVLHDSEENPELFQLVFETFRFLDATPHPVANLHLQFLLELSALLGFRPEGGFAATHPIFDLQEGRFRRQPPPHPHYLEGEMCRHFDALLHASRESCHTLALSREARKTLLRALLDFYRLHLEHFKGVRSHLVLEAVLGK